MEEHANIIGLVSSLCMLLVTTIYAIITWWQARYAKRTLLESIKQNKEDRQPYIVPEINDVNGGAFDTSSYLRIQFSFKYKLKNVSKYYYSKGLIASGFSKINIEFDLGEYVAITGESGSGKSSFRWDSLRRKRIRRYPC